MKKIKDVVVVNDFAYVQGGASKVAIDTANLLEKNGYRVHFFTGQTNEKAAELNKNIHVISLEQPEALRDRNKLRGIKNGLYNKTAYQKLTDLLSNLNPDETIVHIHSWTKILSSSIFEACFKLGFKTVLTLHDYFAACPNGGFFNYRQNQICPLRAMGEECIKTNCDSRNYAFKLYRVWRQKIQNDIGVLSKIENVIYISDLQWSVLESYFSNIKHAQKILNPIDTDANHVVKKHPDGPYIYVGRLSKEKGIMEFCEGVTMANVPAIVAGDGPLLKNLREKYPNIRFLGWQDHDMAISLMEKAKCLIFPSLWYEGEPLVPIEASRVGLPCIISDKSSSKEFIQTGYIYDGNSVDSLAEAIKNFELNYPKLQIKPQRFNDNYLENIINFYDKALS